MAERYRGTRDRKLLRISLCLLTWNEAHGCSVDLPHIDPSSYFEVFALDGGSTDGTLELLSEAGISVVAQRQRSYNAAYIEALEHFAGDALIFFHPKGTIDPSSLDIMRAKLEAGADLVIASRMLDHSTNEEDDGLFRPRKWFGQGLSIAASARWNRARTARITDPLHGYRACSRAFADDLSLLPRGVTADLEMVKHAYANDARVEEFAIHEAGREVGDTHFPAWSTGKQLVRFLMTK